MPFASLPPVASLGMLGGGQLGRMSILAGRRLGYGFQVYEPSGPYGPAAQVADGEINAPWEDRAALQRFARSVRRATLEFENIPPAALETVQELAPVFPGPEVLAICQNRAREKQFLQAHGFPCAPFAVVHSAEDLKAAVARLGLPAVLKTAAWGYDGKGQQKLEAGVDLDAAWSRLGAPAGVLEAWVDFSGEFSVLCARNGQGGEAVFPVAENIHRHHILHLSLAPARLSEAQRREAEDLGRAIADQLDLVGLLAVELFLTARGWVVNELAPRPHNSGHYTFDACLTSQFEQHIRAICGLPLGSPELLSPVVMVNLLGDLWRSGTSPDWEALLAHPRAKLHLYGKPDPRPGRKMGHFTVLGPTLDQALADAQHLFTTLGG